MEGENHTLDVEHVMREQNVLAANEFIELFSDLKEGIASLIFVSPVLSASDNKGFVAHMDLIILKASLVSSSALTNGLGPFLNVKVESFVKVKDERILN
ncbi:hypothetical protein TSUD_20000 [Trifolium subterraneum]|uniref:Uncharacterized protein n=1 Tax=Trifolium subterraneum TaxID=3900 RepID=A0A2Z6MNY6_TRISU|nr:hypothetical protein TSUD_20000 [Trifolium subterraneum]